MDKSRICAEEGKVSFSNRTELIQFVSNYLALEYKRHLEFWRATARDDWRERIYWEKRIESEVPKFEKAIKIFLRNKLKHSCVLNITYESIILKKAFRKARIIASFPEVCFPVNVEYKINKLVFEKVVKPYRS